MTRTRLLAPAVALAVVLTGGACADDGFSPFAPEAGISGTWVRDEPFNEPTVSSYWVPVFDTLVLRTDRTGRWSTTVVNAESMMPLRVEQHVWFEPSVLLLRLWAIPEPCDACRLADPRLAPANWVAFRKSEDRLELRMLLHPSIEGLEVDSRLGEDVYRYRRIPAP
jgi:hypothetical protein